MQEVAGLIPASSGTSFEKLRHLTLSFLSRPLCASPLCVQQGGVVASHHPGRFVSVVQVKPTSFRTVAALIGKVVAAASERAQEGLKATSCGEAAGPAEAQVPLAHHVRSVSGLQQALWQRGEVWGQTEGLTWSDD